VNPFRQVGAVLKVICPEWWVLSKLSLQPVVSQLTILASTYRLTLLSRLATHDRVDVLLLGYTQVLMLVPSSASEVLVALRQALLHHFHLHLENMITSILKGHSPYKVTNAQVMCNKYATSHTPLIIITDHCAPCEHSKQGLTSIKL